jgi:hypothetical protein
MAKTKKTGGVSLAKGPIALIGALLLAYGVTAFIMGGHSFALDFPGGTVNGKTWLGLEVNAWSSLLFVAAGVLLLISAPAHWAAKTMSLIVGLALVAAAVIALYDKHDVLGIFAANGPTRLVWGIAGLLLIVLSLLPRVGRNKATGASRDRGDRERRETRSDRDAAPRFGRDTSWNEEPDTSGSRAADRDRLTTPNSNPPEPLATTRRQRNR